MTPELEKLIKCLEVERVDKYLFIGNSPKSPKRVFGGQVLAQSLNAAIRSVDDDRVAHSMHAYFLRPGDPSKQIVFEVDPIRDGRTFATRRVVAKQDGRAIFNTSVSFQLEEEGLEHQMDGPKVPAPEDVETDLEYWENHVKGKPDAVKPPTISVLERRMIERRDYNNPTPGEPIQNMWFRVPQKLSDDRALHQTLLAYISDYSLLGAALRPHPYTGASGDLQLASLDHALWFHRALRVDDYLLYTMDSPNSGGGRGFSRGSFYTQDGVLVASTAQESLLRVRKSEA
ncbi:MAG: acyl-CoA thioesterase II [Halioglobus sp.]